PAAHGREGRPAGVADETSVTATDDGRRPAPSAGAGAVGAAHPAPARRARARGRRTGVSRLATGARPESGTPGTRGVPDSDAWRRRPAGRRQAFSSMYAIASISRIQSGWTRLRTATAVQTG